MLPISPQGEAHIHLEMLWSIWQFLALLKAGSHEGHVLITFSWCRWLPTFLPFCWLQLSQRMVDSSLSLGNVCAGTSSSPCVAELGSGGD